MNENEIESGRCDFCQINEPKHTINGGLWWICDRCMSIQMNMNQARSAGGEEE